MKIDITACARCGMSHTQLDFVPFTRAPDGATHWAKCPNACDPILLDIETECCGCRDYCNGSCSESEIVKAVRQRIASMLPEGKKADATFAWVLRVAIQEGEKAERERQEAESNMELCRCGHSRMTHTAGGRCTILTCPNCREFELHRVAAFAVGITGDHQLVSTGRDHEHHAPACRCGHSAAVHIGRDGACKILTCESCVAFVPTEHGPTSPDCTCGHARYLHTAGSGPCAGVVTGANQEAGAIMCACPAYDALEITAAVPDCICGHIRSVHGAGACTGAIVGTVGPAGCRCPAYQERPPSSPIAATPKSDLRMSSSLGPMSYWETGLNPACRCGHAYSYHKAKGPCIHATDASKGVICDCDAYEEIPA